MEMERTDPSRVDPSSTTAARRHLYVPPDIPRKHRAAEVSGGGRCRCMYVNHTRKHQWLGRDQTGVSTVKPGLHPKKIMLSC